MASQCVAQAYPYLKILAENKNDKPLCKHLLRKKFVLQAIKEVTYNCLKQNFPIDSKQKKKLKRFQKELLVLAEKKCSKKQETVLTGQRGGQLLTTLLAVGLPILANLLFSKKHDTIRE